MKNTYKDSFEINLGVNFILSCLAADIVPVAELYDLDEKELRILIYSSLIDAFSKYTITSVDEEVTISANWEDFLNNNLKSLSVKIELNTFKSITIRGQKNYLSYCIESYLYELFLLLNLSIPGSITLFVQQNCRYFSFHPKSFFSKLS